MFNKSSVSLAVLQMLLFHHLNTTNYPPVLSGCINKAIMASVGEAVFLPTASLFYWTSLVFNIYFTYADIGNRVGKTILVFHLLRTIAGDIPQIRFRVDVWGGIYRLFVWDRTQICLHDMRISPFFTRMYPL